MKIQGMILGLCLLAASMSFGQSTSSVRQVPLSQSQIRYDLNINDSTSAPLIDKINEYSLKVNAIRTLEELEKNFSNRIRWEFHFGTGTGYDRMTDSVQGALMVSVKLNLNNPKLPSPKNILAKANKIRNYLAIGHYEFADNANRRLDSIEGGTKEYLDQMWWKRLSIGLSFLKVNTTETRSSLAYTFDAPAFFVGYDFGDILTMQLGYSYFRQYGYLGASLDISTPVYLMASNFYNMLRGFGNTPNGSRNYFY